jgi:LysR family transcriptional regulator, hypochlorite-specific transcription factor HypT
MELKWIEDFLSLSASSSFSRSANERHVTQSALSRRIKQLETWLDVPLFDRTTYPVRLTPEGREFLPKAKEILLLLNDTRRSLQCRHRVEAEVLCFATLNTLSLTFFPHWIRSLEARIGAVNTRFSDKPPSFVSNVALLIDGESDFLLTYAHPKVQLHLDPPRFAFRRLGEERVIPVSVPDADGRPLHVIRAEGPPTSYLSYGSCSFFARWLAKLFAERPLPLATVYENASSAGLKAMVLAGRGVAWIPESLVRDELRSGALVPAADPSWHLIAEIRLYRTVARGRLAVERFWSAIEDYAETSPRLAVASAAA